MYIHRFLERKIEKYINNKEIISISELEFKNMYASYVKRNLHSSAFQKYDVYSYTVNDDIIFKGNFNLVKQIVAESGDLGLDIVE